MLSPLFIAGALSIILGLVHSIMGEVLIFRAGEVSTSRFRGIIRASWHLASLLGFALAALLFSISGQGIYNLNAPLGIVAVCLLVGGGLVFWATKGRHPGWAVLWTIAVCIFISVIS